MINSNCLSRFVLFERLVFLVEIRRALAFFRDQAEFEPLVVFRAELRAITFFRATLRTTFRKWYDVISGGFWCLMFQLGRHLELPF